MVDRALGSQPAALQSEALEAASRGKYFLPHVCKGARVLPPRAFPFGIVLFAVFGFCRLRRAGNAHGGRGEEAGLARPTIVFMTDFGTANDAVAICKAVILGIAPDARIMDITHQVTPFRSREASRFLAGVTPYYPAGTVFLVVVDPGVGTSRKAVIVKSKKGQYFVLPDNGLITPVVDRDGLEGAREITNHRVDDRRQDFVDFSRARCFFAGGARIWRRVKIGRMLDLPWRSWCG